MRGIRRGIRTVAQEEMEYVAFEKGMRGKSGGTFSRREDIVPSWFGEYEERQRAKG